MVCCIVKMGGLHSMGGTCRGGSSEGGLRYIICKFNNDGEIMGA